MSQRIQYSNIFRDTDPYSSILTGERKRAGLLFLFFEMENKCPDFWKKGPDCVHLCVKFPFKMQLCSSVVFYLCFWWNVYQSALFLRNLLWPENLRLCACTQASLFFWKCSILTHSMPLGTLVATLILPNY